MNSQTFLDLIRRSSNLVTGLKYKNSPPEICSMDNCEIIIPTKLFTYSVIKEFFDGTYEKKERYLIKKYLKPTDRVLELGGGVGVVSCMTNKILSDPKAHIVIEANPNLIPTLETNRDRNNCKFKIIQCDPTSSGSGKLFVNKNAWASSTIKGQGEYINIPTRSWSYINKETGLDPTVLIMDIEGG